MHQTRIFFVLDSRQVEPIARLDYVRLLRGELAFPEYANQAMRVADWYVEMEAGRPVALHNETYSLLYLDGQGRVRWPDERHGKRANHAFYAALTNSTRADPDDDPAVQQLRRELRSEYAWLPNEEERSALRAAVFPAVPGF